MKFSVIASGSKGNMTYVETKAARILIDAGISLKDASQRVKAIDFSKITHVFITHRHGDHIKFLKTVLKKTNASLYIHKKCFASLDKPLQDELKPHKIYFIEENSEYRIADFIVHTLLLSHDAFPTLGYVFIEKGVKLTYIADTGIFFEKYIDEIKNSDILIIEANHSVDALLNSTRDWLLKQRILSDEGHLSNQKCLEILERIYESLGKYVVLAHISEECNSLDDINKELLIKIKNKYLGEILIAKQNEATNLIEV